MSDENFLRKLQQRGVSFHLWNSCVRWAGGKLSKREARRLRRLRPQVEALIAKQFASPAVIAGVDPRWETIPSSDWSWRPPCHVDPGRVIYSRPKAPSRHSKKCRPPPGEAHWPATLGKRLAQFLEDAS